MAPGTINNDDAVGHADPHSTGAAHSSGEFYTLPVYSSTSVSSTSQVVIQALGVLTDVVTTDHAVVCLSDPATKGSATTSAPQPLDAYGEMIPSDTTSTAHQTKLQHRPAATAATAAGAAASTKKASRRGPFATSSPSLNASGNLADSSSSQVEEDNVPNPPESSTPASEHTAFRVHQSLLVELFNWLHQERAKVAAARKRKSAAGTITPDSAADTTSTSTSAAVDDSKRHCCHHAAEAEETSLALDQLELILAQHLETGPATTETARPKAPTTAAAATSTTTSGRRAVSSSSSTPNPKRQSPAVKALRRGSSSESDSDADRPVPSAADVVLDNSKTLLYSGGEADCDLPSDGLAPAAAVGATSGGVNGARPPPKEREHWLHFKSEIVRLTHTLGFKGWRRIPLDASGNVEVVRLSGALTNAVYVVSPPKNLPTTSRSGVHRKPPPKLLLRIYGPQVEHLIDRERELRILRRLAKKNIGPRVLGTFKNGRFEEYFYARTLTSSDLRVPETSVQIAKRMRELHDGIELLPEERAAGPTIWENWDKWVGRCEQVITWLDAEITSSHNEKKAEKEPWRKRGYVCCVPWAQFRSTVERLRKWLDEVYGGPAGLRQKLVFAHNDTQYGNLLRLEPSGESPLLLPANEHKRLVVIDFEYSSANTKAFEFANHFTEWCYNYHDAEMPEACHANWYPTAEEQERFVRAYLKHRSNTSNFSVGRGASSSSTSAFPATYTSSPRIPPFTLDSHAPSPASLSGTATPDPESRDRERDREQDRTFDAETEQLLRETRLWRVANSAQWVAWGIVQAEVEGLEEALASDNNNTTDTAGHSACASGDASAPTNGDDSSEATATPDQTDNSSTEGDTGTGASADPSSAQVMQEVEAEEVAEDFDYLAYAQQRSLFFWADIWELGLVKEEDFPEGMVEHVKKRAISR